MRLDSVFVLVVLVVGGCAAPAAPASPPSAPPAALSGHRTATPGEALASPSPVASPRAASGEPPAATPSRPPTPTPSPVSSPSPKPQRTAPLSPTPAPRSGCLHNAARDRFVTALIAALERRDGAALESSMAARFRFVVEATDVVLDPVPRATAVRQLTRGVPDPEGQPWFRPLARGADIDCAGAVSLADLDADATFWPGWDVGVLSIGWGADGRAEAIMVLGHRADGRPVWRGLFYSAAGFELPR